MKYSISVLVVMVLCFSYMSNLAADESASKILHIYNKTNPSANLDMVVDLNKQEILINKMEFSGPVATGDVSHRTNKPIELKINNLLKSNDSITIEAGYKFEEGLALVLEIVVLLDETTKQPLSAEMDVKSSLEEIIIMWRPQLLLVEYK